MLHLSLFITNCFTSQKLKEDATATEQDVELLDVGLGKSPVRVKIRDNISSSLMGDVKLEVTILSWIQQARFLCYVINRLAGRYGVTIVQKSSKNAAEDSVVGWLVQTPLNGSVSTAYCIYNPV
jgi:hypothetical protein